MSKIKIVAVLGCLSYVINCVAQYLSTGAMPDFATLVTMVTATYAALHTASVAASVAAAPAPVAPPAAK